MIVIVDGNIQVVFVDISSAFANVDNVPLFLWEYYGLTYWVYMSVYEIEDHIKVLQNVGDDLSDWKPHFWGAHVNLLWLWIVWVQFFYLFYPNCIPRVDSNLGFICWLYTEYLDRRSSFKVSYLVRSSIILSILLRWKEDWLQDFEVIIQHSDKVFGMVWA